MEDHRLLPNALWRDAGLCQLLVSRFDDGMALPGAVHLAEALRAGSLGFTLALIPEEAGRLLVLVLVEFTDLVFAVDSIPAIFAITTDPFIVLTSNVFAILGLRAMYFLLKGVADRFHLLKYGLAAVLVFVGTKMLIVEWVKIPVALSLGTVAVILAIAVVASLMFPHPESKAQGTAH